MINCDDCRAELRLRKVDAEEIPKKRLYYFHTHIEPLVNIAKELYYFETIQQNFL